MLNNQTPRFRALRSYLKDHFLLDRSDVKDLSIREEDNSIRLLVQSHDAVIKADRIAKEVHSISSLPIPILPLDFFWEGFIL